LDDLRAAGTDALNQHAIPLLTTTDSTTNFPVAA
jgi:hypothetical protein